MRQAVLADGQLEEAAIRSAADKLSHRELEAPHRLLRPPGGGSGTR